MIHFVTANARRAGRNLPWLLCQTHLEQLPAEQQALYVGCTREQFVGPCFVRPQDCERCPQPD